MGGVHPAPGKNAVRYKKQMNMADCGRLTDYEDFVRRTMEDNQKRGGVAHQI